MQTAKPAANKFGLPYLGYGLGLRSQHYDYIINNKPEIDWFEVISENYMNSRGRPLEKLHEIRKHYPIVMHGVSLSIGSTDALNMEYLQKLKKLADDINPIWISDHLCWTGINGKNTHDLLPIPLTQEALQHLIPRIKQVQDFLERPLILENPSSYLTFTADHIPEYEFISELAEQTDCGILLDVNNIYVASYNQRISPFDYIDAIPKDRVVQFHLAGHTNLGTHIVDTHDNPVNDDVWALYDYAAKRFGNISTMIEWDGNIPEFPILEAELAKAKQHRPPAEIKTTAKLPGAATNQNLFELQSNLQSMIHNGDIDNAATWISAKENFTPEQQAFVYISAYRIRLAENILADYPETAEYMGESIKPLIMKFIETTPSTHTDLAAYSWQFADFIPDEKSAELADIERKCAKCFDLENSAPATAKDFAVFSEEGFLNLHLYPRKASFLIHLKTNIDGAHRYLAVYRKEDDIHKLPLEKAEYELLHQLGSGKTIGEALEALKEDVTAEELQNWFSKWLENEFISADYFTSA